MPYSPVLVVTFWVLMQKTITNEDDIATIINKHFDGYSDFKRQDIITLWHDLLRDLPEWLKVVGDHEQGDALVQDVLAAVGEGRPKIPTFPRELQPGAPCSEEEVEEVRMWMWSGGKADALMKDSDVVG